MRQQCCNTLCIDEIGLFEREREKKLQMENESIVSFLVSSSRSATFAVPGRDISHNQLFLRAAWKEHNGHTAIFSKVFRMKEFALGKD